MTTVKAADLGFYWIEDGDGDICVAELVRYGTEQRWLAPGVVSEKKEHFHVGYAMPFEAARILSGPLASPGPRYHDAVAVQS